MIISCIDIIKSNIHPERFYIGSTVDFIKRKKFHIFSLNKEVHSNSKIQRHFKKYGIEDFSFEILKRVHDKQLLLETEQLMMDEMKPYFNILKVAGSRLGVKMSAESKAKLSDSRMGISYGPLSVEQRKNLSEIHKRNMTPERRRRISESAKRPCKEETKEKIRLSNLGKKRNPETIANMAASMKGKKMSTEVCLKISATMTGRTYSAERVEKTRLANIGRVVTKEAREKMSIRKKGKVQSVESRLKRSISMKEVIRLKKLNVV